MDGRNSVLDKDELVLLLSCEHCPFGDFLSINGWLLINLNSFVIQGLIVARYHKANMTAVKQDGF